MVVKPVPPCVTRKALVKVRVPVTFALVRVALLFVTLIVTLVVGIKVRPVLLAVRTVTLPTFRLICEPAD